MQQCLLIRGGTVALRANDAEPASIGVMAERQSRGAHVFTTHLNTRFSAYVMLRVGSRGSMQQCPPAPVLRPSTTQHHQEVKCEAHSLDTCAWCHAAICSRQRMSGEGD